VTALAGIGWLLGLVPGPQAGAERDATEH